MTVPTAAADELLKERRGAVLILTLNRPEALNAFTIGMLDDLFETLKKAEKDNSVRCVVLTGSGRAFCAGADLGELQKRQADRAMSLGDELRRRFNPLILQVRRMEKPVLGAVNGVAAGAGASLILSCDMKICAEDAKFINAFVRVGLVPDSGMTFFMPRYLGLSQAFEHAALAKPITPAQALARGWVNAVVPAAKVLEETFKAAREICSQAPLALALTKRALNRSLENTLEGQMEYEAQLQDVLGRTADHREGVASFIEKRPPVFKGQ